MNGEGKIDGKETKEISWGGGYILPPVLGGGYMRLLKTHWAKHYDLCILLKGNYTSIFLKMQTRLFISKV